MKAPIGFAIVVLAFALAVAALVSIVYGLARRGRRGDALLALVVPLAPWLAFRAGLRVRALVFGGAAVAYLIARAVVG